MPLFTHQQAKTSSKVHYSQYLHVEDRPNTEGMTSMWPQKNISFGIQILNAILHRVEPSAKGL